MTTFGKKPQSASGGFGKKPSRSAASAGGGYGAAPASGGLSSQAQSFLDELQGEKSDSYEYASPARNEGHAAGTPVGFMRVFSFLIDTLLITVPFFIIMGPQFSAIMETLATVPEGSAAATQANIQLLMLIIFHGVVRAGYSIGMEATSQATLGKKILGQIVTDKNGNKPSLLAVIMRNTIGRFIANLLPFCLGYVIAFFGGKQGVHDMLSGTQVCSKSRGVSYTSEAFA